MSIQLDSLRGEYVYFDFKCYSFVSSFHSIEKKARIHTKYVTTAKLLRSTAA